MRQIMTTMLIVGVALGATPVAAQQSALEARVHTLEARIQRVCDFLENAGFFVGSILGCSRGGTLPPYAKPDIGAASKSSRQAVDGSLGAEFAIGRGDGWDSPPDQEEGPSLEPPGRWISPPVRER